LRLFATTFAALDPKRLYGADARRSRGAGVGAALAGIRGKPVVAWHTSWRYLADYTGMNIVGFMEPKPGVPPSPSHLAGLIATMKRTGARVIIMEPFYDRKTADFVASKTGAAVLVLPPSVGGVKAAADYFTLMRYDLEQLAAALQ
jgi:ABC-type Zn uptake system ZnuABC Zn-binding protein ZnuA